MYNCQRKKQSPKFAIYKIKEDSKFKGLSFGHYDGEKYIDGETASLDEIIYEETPVITEKDIKNYNWRTHEIELREEYIKNSSKSKDSETELYGGCKLLNANDLDEGIVVIDGKKIYAAGFPLRTLKSQSPAEIIISQLDGNKIKISNSRKKDDIRSNLIIYDSLKASGKLIE
jgi:hypothetical protein